MAEINRKVEASRGLYWASLRIARAILLKSFAIGFALMLISSLLTFLVADTWTALVMKYWHIEDRNALWMMVIQWYAAIKFYLIYILLIPGLGLHWTLRSLEKKAP